MDCHVVILTLLLELSVYLIFYGIFVFVLSFYCCHQSEFLMTSEDNIDISSGHIMNAIEEIRNNKKRLDNKSITEFIQKNHSINADFNFIEEGIEKLSKMKRL